MRRILMIAYHFPPCAVSSGIQRTLSFVKHLPDYGWLPTVLTVNPGAYERTNDSQLKSIPPQVAIERSFSFDTARHLSFRGRYLSSLARPDRWRSWWLTAVPAGLAILRRQHHDLIWSTYPITTAHNIAASLARLTRVPWVADFRDPMVEYVEQLKEWFPQDQRLREARLKSEARAAARARLSVFCTGGARNIFAERYSHVSSDRLAVVSNGYDELAFQEAEALAVPPRQSAKKILLHSGTIYLGTDRDPTALFTAIRALADRGILSDANFELRLRDPSSVGDLRRLIDKFQIAPMVSILESMPYARALAEMLHVDGLLALQGFTSNPAVPAKLYEYLRARRPIIGLVDPNGETASTLLSTGIKTVANITDSTAIEKILENWFSAPRDSLQDADAKKIAGYARSALTRQFAAELDRVADTALRK